MFQEEIIIYLEILHPCSFMFFKEKITIIVVLDAIELIYEQGAPRCRYTLGTLFILNSELEWI
jgi:hypothetical protein